MKLNQIINPIIIRNLQILKLINNKLQNNGIYFSNFIIIDKSIDNMKELIKMNKILIIFQAPFIIHMNLKNINILSKILSKTNKKIFNL